MNADKSPYSEFPETSFWRPSVANKHIYDWADLYSGRAFGKDDAIATAGSCFAQHISRHLKKRGARFVDLEPAPEFLTKEQHKSYGYGLYSCRYGNVYTVRQLLQLMQESLGERVPQDLVWEKNGRFYDALRPSVDPVGHDTKEAVLSLRKYHLECVKELWKKLDVFVFTLGLTEAWESTLDGTVFPTAPGTIAGSYSVSKYRFHNFRYPEIYSDLKQFWDLLRKHNPKARLLLTVSPVPLTATASGDHVLVATNQSKATLRAVAGDFAACEENVSYFPSYEIICSHPSRAMFFNPDMRTVNNAGVEYVMSHFFKDTNGGVNEVISQNTKQKNELELPNVMDNNLACDEELIERVLV